MFQLWVKQLEHQEKTHKNTGRIYKLVIESPGLPGSYCATNYIQDNLNTS